jgi:phage/plasmid-associated DNA primase
MDKKSYTELRNAMADGQITHARYYYEHNKDDIKVCGFVIDDSTIYIWNNVTRLWETSSKKDLQLCIADFYHKKIKSAITYLKEEDEGEKANVLQKQLKNFTSAAFAAKIVEFVIPLSFKDSSNFLEYLNSKRDLLQFKNGALNLRTGELRERQKTDYCTTCLRYDYAESKQEDLEYVNNIFKNICNNNDETTEFMKGYHGYTLTGEISAQTFLIIYGATAGNGKTTLSEIQMACLPIYTQFVNRQAFEAGYERGHKHLIKIGAPIRYVRVEELSEKNMDTELLKEVTGNRSIGVEVMFGTTVQIPIHCKVNLISNKPPQFKTDNGMCRRGLLVELKNQFKSKEEIKAAKDKTGLHEKDRLLVNRFQENNSYKLAFINLLLPYARKFYQSGDIHIPTSVKDAFSELAEENDKMTQFIQNYFERTNNNNDKLNKLEFAEMYNAYNKCKESFSNMLGDLKRLKITYIKDNSHKNIKGVIYGLRIKQGEDEDKNDNKVWQEDKNPEIKEREIKIQAIEEPKQTDSLGDDIYKLLQEVRKFAEEQTKFGQEQEKTLQLHKGMKLKKHITHDDSDDVDDERVIVTGIINSYKKKMNKFECDEKKMKEMRTKPDVNDDDYDEFMGESFKMFR